MTYELVKDFNSVLEVIPDNFENIRQEKARQERLEKYTRDLVAYAKGEIKVLEVPETAPIRSEEQVNSEIERMKINPTRVDRLNDFKNFLGQEANNLHQYAQEFPHLTAQQAWNFANAGPVGISAEEVIPDMSEFLLLHLKANRPSWNPRPQVINILKGHTGGITSVAITPDGKFAFSGSKDKTCILWDLITGQAIKSVIGHSDKITAIKVTPDSKHALSGSSDSTCILWDLENGQEQRVLKGHSLDVDTIEVTPDSKYMVSGSKDTTCILWDLKTGLALKTIKGHRYPVTAISFTPDSNHVLSVSDKTCLF